jgi:mannan endo-1,4-beta-mannosidase
VDPRQVLVPAYRKSFPPSLNTDPDRVTNWCAVEVPGSCEPTATAAAGPAAAVTARAAAAAHDERRHLFQYFDGTSPQYNDGADGLAHLDYEVWKAKQDGLRLVIPFTNNWSDFGGMDQYVRWAGLSHHDDFYTSPVIRSWFQAYISHLLNHVNPLTGLALKDDPTIMSWELANEPRCVGSGLYPASASCSTATLTSWASDTAKFVKHLDPHHLIGVGDEGFFATAPNSGDNTVDGKSGDDTLALSAIPQIDYLSYHLYPDSWGKDADWGTSWITEHNLAARMLNKPAVLGEFGYADRASRNTVDEKWAQAFTLTGGSGWEYWMSAGTQDDGTPYPDYDGYTTAGGWFGTNLATPVDLSGKTALSVDLRTGAAAGSSVNTSVDLDNVRSD